MGAGGGTYTCAGAVELLMILPKPTPNPMANAPADNARQPNLLHDGGVLEVGLCDVSEADLYANAYYVPVVGRDVWLLQNRLQEVRHTLKRV